MSNILTDRAIMAAPLSGGDLIHIVDVSDSSQNPAGSSYKLTLTALATFLTPTLAVTLAFGNTTGGTSLLISVGDRIDSATTSGTLLIGTSDAGTVTIGLSGSTINLAASTLNITDKLITLNDGGGAASGTSAGFEIEESGSVAGYFKTDSSARTSYLLKAPASFEAELSLSVLSANRKYTFPNAAGTIITTGNLTAITATGTIASGVWNGTSITTTHTDAKIKGAVAATAGLIPYGTGAADTVTSSANLFFDDGNKRFKVGSSFPTYASVAISETDSGNTFGFITQRTDATGFAAIGLKAGAADFFIYKLGNSVAGNFQTSTVPNASLAQFVSGNYNENFAFHGSNLYFFTSLSASTYAASITSTGALFGVIENMGTNASAAVHVIKTTEQLRVGYDASNYYKTTVSSAGKVTFDAVGSSSAFVFSDNVWIGAAAIQVPTAYLQLADGTSGAGKAPLKFTSGTNLATGETGAVEYDGTNLFFTRTGTTRENIWCGNDAASAPGTNSIGVILDYYGSSNTRVLTTPNSWASVNIGGTTYKIPLYT